MNDLISIAPVLGGLGSFAFACVMCFIMLQHMRSQSDRMLDLVETHIDTNTAAVNKLTVVIEKLDTRVDAARR